MQDRFRIKKCHTYCYNENCTKHWEKLPLLLRNSLENNYLLRCNDNINAAPLIQLWHGFQVNLSITWQNVSACRVGWKDGGLLLALLHTSCRHAICHRCNKTATVTYARHVFPPCLAAWDPDIVNQLSSLSIKKSSVCHKVSRYRPRSDTFSLCRTASWTCVRQPLSLKQKCILTKVAAHVLYTALTVQSNVLEITYSEDHLQQDEVYSTLNQYCQGKVQNVKQQLWSYHLPYWRKEPHSPTNHKH